MRGGLARSARCFRGLNQADMGGDNAPAFGHANPGLALASDFRRAVSVKFGAGGGEIAAIGGNHSADKPARQTGRRTRRTEGLDRLGEQDRADMQSHFRCDALIFRGRNMQSIRGIHRDQR